MKWCVCVFFLLIQSLYGLSIHLPPKVSLQVNEQDAFEGNLLPLYISVDHMKSDVVDTKSFKLDGQSIEVQPIGDTEAGQSFSLQSGEEDSLFVSRYKTILPSRTYGVYTIGPVEVTVQGIPVQSNLITVQVSEAVVTDEFTLESTIEKPSTIYPGQRIKVTYTLHFPTGVQLLKEQFPLLDLEGFLALEAPRVTDSSQSNGFSQERIERSFRATRAGTFQFQPSIIEGMRFVERNGTRNLIPPLMRSKEEGKTLEITPFPERGKPPFFEGAIGSFTWRGRVIGSNQVNPNSSIEVEWRVNGRGDIDTVHLPALENNPNFSSRFLFKGAPQETQEDEYTKSFRVYLQPKTMDVKEVPSFQFASFDPIAKQYIVSFTQPLPLVVEEQKIQKGSSQEPLVEEHHPFLPYDPELYKNMVDEPPLTLERVWMLFALFAVVGFVEKKAFAKRSGAIKIRHSKDLFYKAFARRRRPEGLKLLREALFLRLFEVGLTTEEKFNPVDLAKEGLIGDVRKVILMIDGHTFGIDKETIDAIWKEASLVYYQMKRMKV